MTPRDHGRLSPTQAHARQARGSTALLVLAVACNPTHPVPPEPSSWTISPQSHCDGSFDYHAVAWDDELPDGLGTPREIVASRSDRLVSVAPWPGWQVPWFRDALTWHIELAPHPRRPAVRLSSSAPEICPPMWVFPVVGVARSERFLIVDSGGRDQDAWGEVYRSTELPWLEGSVSAVRVYQDGSMETDVDLNPAEDLLFSTWPDGLAEDMALFAPGDEGLDVPVVRFSENAETAELSLYHVRYFPRGAIYSGGAGGGVADARAALPWTTCAQPDPAVDEADRQALAAWTSADRTLLLDIDWLVPPSIDSSHATLRIEQVGEPMRVAVPVEGVCTTTVLAALDGELSIGGWSVDVISVALEVRNGAVIDTRLHGEWRFDGDRSYYWHQDVAEALGRPERFSQGLLVRVENGRAVLTMRSILGHPEQVAGEGTAVWEPL